MKKISTIILALLFAVTFSFPAFAGVATNPGIKPDSFLYFFDTAFEKVGLFFAFSPEKKAEKALRYADERLAEAEAVTDNADAVKTAVTNYENNIAFAEEKSKDVENKEKAEALLTAISDNTSKHQEILTNVLAKVPDEAKEAIVRAIEASRRGQEEAIRKIAELQGEVEKLRQEIAELKAKDGEREKTTEELNERKQRATPTPASISAQPSASKSAEITPVPKSATTSQISIKKDELQSTPPANQTQDNNTNIPTPSSSPTPSSLTPPPITTRTETLEITSVSVVPDVISVRIEWQTNKPTSAKVFISGGGLSSKVYSSESGLSTRHVANIAGLISNTSYSYEIESIAGEQVAKKDASFTTKTGELIIQTDKTSIQLADWNYIKITAQYTEKGEVVPADISFSTPNDSKTYKVIQNWPACGTVPFLIQLVGATGGSCSSDGKATFEYRPKSLGAHTISVSTKGVEKTVDIKVAEYVKIDPAIRDVVNSNPIFEINSTEGKSIGGFKFSQADEPIEFDGYDYKYESAITTSGFLRIIRTGEGYQLRVTPKTNTYALVPGIYSVKITEIKVVGISSGSYRYVSGLPITFTFEIKDIPSPEIIPIKTTHTHNVMNETSWPPLDPGDIGSFNIKYATNGCIKIESYDVRIENETKNSFSGGIGNGGRTCVVGGTNMSSDTDSSGVTKTPFVFGVNNLLMDGVTNRSWNYRAANPPISVGNVKFYIENMKVKDQTTGLIRNVLNPPVFELEIAIPYY